MTSGRPWGKEKEEGLVAAPVPGSVGPQWWLSGCYSCAVANYDVN